MRKVSKQPVATKVTMASVLVATDLWERVQAVAGRRSQTVAELVERALEREVGTGTTGRARRKTTSAR
jgi:hypothetical protein